MTTEEKKAKVMASIASRGWSLAEVYFSAAKELQDEGKIKLSDRYFTGGSRKQVWVAA